MWAKVSDDFVDDPRVLETSLEALGLHVLALSYCGRHLTDGLVTKGVLRHLARDPDAAARLAAELVKAQLWRSGPEGYELVDFREQNPSAKTVMAERKAARVRMRKHRQRVRPNFGGTNAELPVGSGRVEESLQGEPEGEAPTTPMQKRLARARDLLELVNSKGFRYQPVKANIDFIRARLEEYDDFTLAAMVNRQWATWKDDERMRVYFRPATLFNREKCSQYVGQLTARDHAWIADRKSVV